FSCYLVLCLFLFFFFFFFSSRRRHTRSKRDWSSDVCSSDLVLNDFLDELFNQFKIVKGDSDQIDEELRQLTQYFESNKTGYTARSEERRVGKECRCRRMRDYLKKRK